jgi:hypothetical protein
MIWEAAGAPPPIVRSIPVGKPPDLTPDDSVGFSRNLAQT